MKITLSLTHDCNLNCSYCYAGNKFKKDMSLETAIKSIDFGMSMCPPGEPLEFGFFGGEPLLNFALIKEAIAYIRKIGKQYFSPINLQITTNGTLLSPSNLAFMCNENIGLCISIDGPSEIHNLNRRFRNGQGSFTVVVDKLQLALNTLQRVQVNAVFGPDSLDTLSKTTEFFIEQGVQLIHFNPNITANWDNTAYSSIEQAYQAIADVYINQYKQKREIAFNLIDSKVVVFLKQGYEASDRCGMGETEWGFSPSGNIYPCERLIGDDSDNNEFCLGNIHTGLNKESRCAILKRRGNHDLKCTECSLQRYCMNWCGCTNYNMTGDTGQVSNFLCLSEKAAINAASYVINELKDNEIFVNHFYRYLDEGRQPVVEIPIKEESHERQSHISNRS